MSNELGASQLFSMLILGGLYTDVAICRCFTKQVFLKISQSPQDNICMPGSLINKVTGLQPGTLFSVAGVLQIQEIFKYILFIEELWATTSKYIFLKQLSILSTNYCHCLVDKYSFEHMFRKNWCQRIDILSCNVSCISCYIYRQKKHYDFNCVQMCSTGNNQQ